MTVVYEIPDPQAANASGRRPRLPGPQAADSVDHGQERHRSASKKTGAKADDQRSIMLVEPMDDADYL
jgi:hypothetical protein